MESGDKTPGLPRMGDCDHREVSGRHSSFTLNIFLEVDGYTTLYVAEEMVQWIMHLPHLIRVQALISSHLQPRPGEMETDDLQGKLDVGFSRRTCLRK